MEEQFRGPLRETDFFREFLEEVAEALDEKLGRLAEEASTCSDPDAFGICDRMEHFVGFGFVACQQYLSATCATDERKSNLELGPKKGEFSLARVVDAAANFWKHRAEWGATPGPQAQRTIRILSAMGIDWTGAYPATDVLWRLQGDLPKRFTHIVPGLAAWREDVIQRGRTV